MKENNKVTGRDLKRELFRGNGMYFFLGIVTTFLIAGVNLFLQWMIQQLMDLLAGEPGASSLQQLTFYTVLMIVVLIGTELLEYASKPVFITKAMKQYKDYAFEKLAEKNISAFSGENSATYISALSNDTNTIETNYLEKIFTLVNLSVTMVGAIVMMLVYSPLLTLIAAVLTCVPIAASMLTGNKLAVLEEQVSEKNSSFLATLKDSLSGFSVVKSFKAEKAIVGLMKESNENVADAKCKRRKKDVLITLIGASAGIIAQLGVFFVGAYMIDAGFGVTPGIVLAFTMLMNFVIAPISQVPGILANRKAALKLMGKLADAISQNVSDEGEMIPCKLEDAIELTDVSFGYKEGEDVLHDINQRFEAGKSYAIVGGSGCGKTTFLNLLMAANGNYRGEIRLDGIELRKISTESLYEIISQIQQSVFVFNRSIIDNITMFRDFDEASIEKAVQQSGLSALIKDKGKGYLCGENGSGLSGGEKQRISIARSLLRKSPVLLVDEATASLDKQTAYHVSESILKLEELTRIVVTHNLDEELLKQYDEVLVLKNGTIHERGRFEELMEKKGYFYSLYSVAQ